MPTITFTRSELMTIRLVVLDVLDKDPSPLTRRMVAPILDKTEFLDTSNGE